MRSSQLVFEAARRNPTTHYNRAECTYECRPISRSKPLEGRQIKFGHHNRYYDYADTDENTGSERWQPILVIIIFHVIAPLASPNFNVLSIPVNLENIVDIAEPVGPQPREGHFEKVHLKRSPLAALWPLR